MIRFFIKLSFFLVIILVVFSFFVSSPRDNEKQSRGIISLDTLSAIKDTVTDLGNFCNRNENTCVTGKVILNSIGERVQNGAKFAYDYLGAKLKNDGHISERNKPSHITTGSIKN